MRVFVFYRSLTGLNGDRSQILVPTARLELAQLSPLPPQDSVSTNSTTSANAKNAILACFLLVCARPLGNAQTKQNRLPCRRRNAPSLHETLTAAQPERRAGAARVPAAPGPNRLLQQAPAAPRRAPRERPHRWALAERR